MGVAPQQRGQHGAGTAADVHHGAEAVPPAGELDVVVRHAVPGGPHERVEVRRDVRVRGEILPERPPEQLLVGWPAGADVVEQRPPRVGHPAADALEIEEAPRVGELLGGVVAVEMPGGLLLEDALGDQVAQHGVQGIAIAAGRGGQVGDVVVTLGDEVGDAQGRGDHQAPGRGQVEHLVEVHAVFSHAGLPSRPGRAAGRCRRYCRRYRRTRRTPRLNPGSPDAGWRRRPALSRRWRPWHQPA